VLEGVTLAYLFLRVNSQLSSWNCKFRQLPHKINKTSITPWNCTTLISLPPPSNYSVCQHDVLQIPPEDLHLCAKCPPNLKIYIFFLILDSKDIKVKQLAVSFNN